SRLIQRKPIVARVAVVSVVSALATVVTSYFVWYQPIGRIGIALVGALAFVLLTTWRLLYGRFLATGPRIKMVVLGTGPVERRFAQRLNALSHTRFVIRGFVAGGELEIDSPESPRLVVLGEPTPDAPLPPELGRIEDALGVCEDRKSTRLNSSHVKISY